MTEKIPQAEAARCQGSPVGQHTQSAVWTRTETRMICSQSVVRANSWEIGQICTRLTSTPSKHVILAFAKAKLKGHSPFPTEFDKQSLSGLTRGGKSKSQRDDDCVTNVTGSFRGVDLLTDKSLEFEAWLQELPSLPGAKSLMPATGF